MINRVLDGSLFPKYVFTLYITFIELPHCHQANNYFLSVPPMLPEVAS